MPDPASELMRSNAKIVCGPLLSQPWKVKGLEAARGPRLRSSRVREALSYSLNY